MARNIKHLEHGMVVEVGSRTKTGLPLVPNEILSTLIKGYIGRGMELYKVILCDLVVMGNHFHAVFVVLDPEQFVQFIGYVKRRLGNAINKLLGRPGGQVWDSGFDSPIILDTRKLLERLEYIYLNPARAGIADSIKKYVGIHTWAHLQSDQEVVTEVYDIPLKHVPTLPKRELRPGEAKAIAARMIQKCQFRTKLKVKPWAWMKFLGAPASFEEMKDFLEKRVELEEAKLRKARADKGQAVMDSEKLQRQYIGRPFAPKKHGRKMVCMSSDIALRVRFLIAYKAFVRQCRAVYERWKLGDYSVEYPPGAFQPSKPKIVVWLHSKCGPPDPPSFNSDTMG